MRCKRRASRFLLLFLALGNALVLSYGQPTPTSSSPRREAPSGVRSGAQLPAGAFLNIEGLSDEQRQAIRNALESTRDESRALREKLQKANKELQDAIYANSFSENFVRGKAAAVAQIESDLAVLRAKVFASVRPMLTQEQIEKIKQNQIENFDRPRIIQRRQGGGRRPLLPGEIGSDGLDGAPDRATSRE